jgi:hypothetical protein
MTASPDMLAKWAASLRQCGRIALVDELQTAPADVELYRVPDVKMNVYFRRWLHIWQHLRDHPEYRFVWCTDGTDVEMLRAPWEEMQPGRFMSVQNRRPTPTPGRNRIILSVSIRNSLKRTAAM